MVMVELTVSVLVVALCADSMDIVMLHLHSVSIGEDVRFFIFRRLCTAEYILSDLWMCSDGISMFIESVHEWRRINALRMSMALTVSGLVARLHSATSSL